MNPRQRRGVLLIALAAVGAVAVFLSVTNYVAEVRSQVGPVVQVLRLAQDAPPYVALTPDMVEPVEVPERWGPENAVSDPLELAGLVPTVLLPAGTVLQNGMLVPPPQLAPGQRELAINVDAETGVAGKIASGDLVDIYATFPGSEANPAQAVIVVEQAQIIDVGTPVATEETTSTGAFDQGQVVPVTFALSVDESLRLAYIESFAQTVRLALRAPLDDETIEDPRRRYQPTAEVAGSSLAPAPPPAAPPEPAGPEG